MFRKKHNLPFCVTISIWLRRFQRLGVFKPVKCRLKVPNGPSNINTKLSNSFYLYVTYLSLL